MQMTLRIDDELAAQIDAREGANRSEKIVALLEAGLTSPKSGLEVLMLSTSQIACLDQLAARSGVTRLELMQRYLTERLNREFVEDRQRQMSKLKKVTQLPV